LPAAGQTPTGPVPTEKSFEAVPAESSRLS
jgi:hypothetical protein